MQPNHTPTPAANNPQASLDQFLVCGLGSLGQYCVFALKEFGVNVIAIEQVKPQSWELPELPDLLDDLIFGDCRHVDILKAAKIERCRAAMIVTTNEQINAETALTIRQLNPDTRLVVRSAKENLNELLREQLGNFIAYEPTQLPIDAFALAALGSEILSLFNLDGEKVRVIQHKIEKEDRWCHTRSVYELNTRTRRILAHSDHLSPLAQSFHQWDGDAAILPGDTLVYIETAENFLSLSNRERATLTHQPKPTHAKNISKYLQEKYHQFWYSTRQQPTRKVALICSLIVLFLLISGTVILKEFDPRTTLLSAFSAIAILLLGGYSDLFGGFEQMDEIPAWLQLYSLGLTLAGTAFVGVLYALVTEGLLSAKFQFLKNRPPVPQQDHIVIIGLGRVGQGVATLLQEFKQSIVGISFDLDFDRSILPEMPLIVGNQKEALAKANLATAKSIVVLTNDEILNLEVALMAQKINPNSHLVVRTLGERLSKSLTQLLPKAQILGAYALAAEAFAGAAFGENIITVFRLNRQTILVTEYQIEDIDTLHGLLLSEVAYGYGVVPLLHQKPPDVSKFMPSDDIRLSVGDRMVVLATIEGLKRIEQGKLRISPKCWRVKIEKALTSDAVFEGANVITRISGCSLNMARELMNNLPSILSTPLYKPQAMRLVRNLQKIQVIASLVSTNKQD
ncbi:potassium channel family protein [Gloeothece verrucosa]|uniref:TrkA-N domain protein n=1 Tax=Gloeothece verrucosa (strain PCC 7822) TaxID=497965 RepID=E0UC74_GLOV7|nr:NAD-binding protein [Gloeothece verrucosa]ADN12831.1 TrkA-N domain protein [Gloeothece verrucosa PCC 7822]